MRKNLFLASLIVGTTLTLCNASDAQIVAKGKFLNQTAPIASRTIFTPTKTGLYCLSVYGTITVADPSSESEWSYNLQWTDDSGAINSAMPLYGLDNEAGSFSNFIYRWGDAIPIEVKAVTPITFSVSQRGPADSSAYSLYYTLQHLE